MRASHPTPIAIDAPNVPGGQWRDVRRAGELARPDGTVNAANRITDGAALPAKRVRGDFEEFLSGVGFRCWNE